MEIYVVQPGDNVDAIAKEFGVNVEQIIYDNQLEYPYALAVGQALLINEYDRNASREIAVSGYAYPFISSWVLEQTLPYLSELPIFSYGFTREGELLPPIHGDDTWMIREAVRFGTLPILTLTPLGPDGNFNNQLIHSVVNNEEYTEKLIQNLLEVMAEKGYEGLDIDFEYILAEDRDAFSAFVRQVAEIMRANGYHTSVALAPKTSADQVGLLYQGKDYRALGEAADHVLLMTYEWGYTYDHLSHKYYFHIDKLQNIKILRRKGHNENSPVYNIAPQKIRGQLSPLCWKNVISSFCGDFGKYLKYKIRVIQSATPVRSIFGIINLIYYFS